MTSWVVTVAAFLAVAMAGVVVELVARTRPSAASSFGQMLTWALRRRSTQLFVVFVWWWLGWHFVTNR